jgi:NLI interacting factor-like phosphatase
VSACVLCPRWTKLRPYLAQFLEGVHELYELHIYTMGDRSYAAEVARILDPDRRYFAERIISQVRRRRMDGQTDRRTDGGKDRQTDRQTDGPTEGMTARILGSDCRALPSTSFRGRTGRPMSRWRTRMLDVSQLLPLG